MKYLHKNKLWLGICVFFLVSFYAYAGLLMQGASMQQIMYLDLLLFVTLALAAGADAFLYYKRQAVRKQLLCCDYVICREPGLCEDVETEVAEHDVRILESQLKEQFDLNCDLQDYIAAWCHEVKLPLSASMLMNEKIMDAALQTAQKEQLEKIRQQLNGALSGCRVQSSLFDLKICAADLMACVKEEINQNQFFLIKNRFELILRVEPVFVYTDPVWFVYVLDQLIQNAVKYATQTPVLQIQSIQTDGQIVLIVEDHGEGIQKSDIRRIFERGYTGHGHHDGKYNSTGMGLYLAAVILERLGHTITVESEYGVFTRFSISLCESQSDERHRDTARHRPQDRL